LDAWRPGSRRQMKGTSEVTARPRRRPHEPWSPSRRLCSRALRAKSNLAGQCVNDITTLLTPILRRGTAVVWGTSTSDALAVVWGTAIVWGTSQNSAEKNGQNACSIIHECSCIKLFQIRTQSHTNEPADLLTPFPALQLTSRNTAGVRMGSSSFIMDGA